MGRRAKASHDDDHHGGAWKVAYADFVTAMMAFFLMMWLLNATTEDQRQGIADYFSPDIPLSAESGGGRDVLAGDSVVRTDTLPGVTQAEDGDIQPIDPQQTSYGEMRAELVNKLTEADADGSLSEHVGVRLTDEGLIVDLFSLEGAPLFTGDGTEPTPLLKELLDTVDDVFAMAENDVAIAGFAASKPIVLRDSDPWTLTSVRADVARQHLADGRTGAVRPARITAHGDRKPLHSNAFDARNDRLELILLTDR